MSLFDVRLRISDPSGFIRLETAVTFPVSPLKQTAYLLPDGYYYDTATTTVDLRISDERIQNWIDLKDEDYATCQAIKAILPQLGAEIGIVRSTTGAESTEYSTLIDTYNYYKSLLADCTSEKKSNENNNSGRWGGSKAVEIAGGNL